jgi:hypothetical protein
VVPNLVSIDGQNTPQLFLKEMFPWMLQSPLFPNIAILMSSTTQSLEQGVDMKGNSEAIAIRANVLALVNKFLEQDFMLIGGEALRAVINLVITEVSELDASSWKKAERPSADIFQSGFGVMTTIYGLI